MKDFTLLKMEGESVDIMCDVCSDYEKFVCYENGKKVLYLELLKALYGCVQSALLWYELFSSTLQGTGFELNPYDAPSFGMWTTPRYLMKTVRPFHM
jgi:hypothetical protein